MSKWNQYVTAKDRGLIKGAIRRAFSRSELRNRIIDDARVTSYNDPTRPKVKNWVRCNVCKIPEAKSYMVVDHIVPVIPYSSSFEELGADNTINRTWCDPSNLQAICPSCHDAKTAIEKQQKKAYKDSLKPPKIPKVKKEKKKK